MLLPVDTGRMLDTWISNVSSCGAPGFVVGMVGGAGE